MVTSAAGLVALTYGLIQAGQDGWGDAGALALMIAGAALLAGFLGWERRLTRALVEMSQEKSGVASVRMAFTHGMDLALLASRWRASSSPCSSCLCRTPLGQYCRLAPRRARDRAGRLTAPGNSDPALLIHYDHEPTPHHVPVTALVLAASLLRMNHQGG